MGTVPTMGIQWGDVTTWFGSGGALVVSSAALVVSVRGQRDARRSADASERSAVAAERANRLAEEEAAKYRVPWVLIHMNGARYVFSNAGDEDALEVEIRCPAAERFGDSNTLRFDRVRAGDDIPLFASRTLQMPDGFAVTWRRPGEGERREWNSVLPA